MSLACFFTRRVHPAQLKDNSRDGSEWGWQGNEKTETPGVNLSSDGEATDVNGSSGYLAQLYNNLHKGSGLCMGVVFSPKYLGDKRWCTFSAHAVNIHTDPEESFVSLTPWRSG